MRGNLKSLFFFEGVVFFGVVEGWSDCDCFFGFVFYFDFDFNVWNCVFWFDEGYFDVYVEER